MIPTTKISINFDLNIRKLKEFYPKKSYTSAYTDIRNFMEKHGFEHQQGSGYVSQKPMSIALLGKIFKEMTLKYDWLHNTTRITKATHVLEGSFDLEKIINKPYKDFTKNTKARKPSQMPEQKPKAKLITKSKTKNNSKDYHR